MRKKLAIIGASKGQLPLCLKAREMGVETYCFAWLQDACCKDHVDHFFPISIFEMDRIVNYCRELGIDGVISNASEQTALVAAYVAEKLGKTGTPYEVLSSIQNKEHVREVTNGIEGLGKVDYRVGMLDDILASPIRPCVLKPVHGSAKKGVNFLDDIEHGLVVPDEFKDALFMEEQYINGKEYSVESISFRGKHDVIQLTEKISTGAPHFVELEHHQPAFLPAEMESRVRVIIPRILSSVGFTDGASHVEIKIDDNGEIYLIEINPRGGGDFISDTLVNLSTDFDYIKQMILVALGDYKSIVVRNIAYAGVYFLSAYSSRLLPYFDVPLQDWMVSRKKESSSLRVSLSNYDRDGYILYKSDRKIVL